MKDELNPNRPSRPADGPEDALNKAFEELLEGPSPHAGPSPAAAGAPGLCPQPGEWIRLASGEARPAEGDRLLAHAAGCGDCAARLRQSLPRVFAGVKSAEKRS